MLGDSAIGEFAIGEPDSDLQLPLFEGCVNVVFTVQAEVIVWVGAFAVVEGDEQ